MIPIYVPMCQSALRDGPHDQVLRRASAPGFRADEGLAGQGLGSRLTPPRIHQPNRIGLSVES